MTNTFESLGIRKRFHDALHKQGVLTPTPIQQETIPLLLSGQDVIAQAQTGTGKTLAFVLPMLEIVNPEQPYIQALILAPTRELAIQISAQLQALAPVVGAGVLAVYGGQDVEAQSRKLAGRTHIIVATPGRLLDHVRRGTVRLSNVKQLVLDEADQMLHMGFLQEVESVLAELPGSKQTMLFSATIPSPIRKLAAAYMRQPVTVRIKPEAVTVEEIRQVAVETTDRAKFDTLVGLVREHQPYLAVLFCRTKIRAKRLTEQLAAEGFEVDELHGDLTQAKREAVMKRFRDAKLQLLVATDVAARGIDVEGVTHVYNYDIPHDLESYIHRIGRTGRAGSKGMAVTLFSPRDRPYLQLIERGIGMPIEHRSERAAPAGRPRSVAEGAGYVKGKAGAGPSGGRRSEGRNEAPQGRSSRGRSQGGRAANDERNSSDRRSGTRRSEDRVGKSVRTAGRFTAEGSNVPGRPSRPDSRPADGRGARSDSRPAEGRGARPDSRPAEGRGARSDSRSEGGRGARPDSRSEGGRGARPDSRSAGGRGARPDSRPADGRGARSDSRPADGRGARSDSRPAEGRGARPDSRPEGGRGARPDSRSAGGRGARPSSALGTRSTSSSRGPGAPGSGTKPQRRRP